MTITPKNRKKTANALLLALSVTVLLGIGLSVLFFGMDKHVIQPDIRTGKTQTMQFEDLCLRPGESCEYALRLSDEYAEKYRVCMYFTDLAPTLTLKKYAYVRMEKDGTVLCDMRLSELFERREVTAEIDFSTGENVIHLIFYIPQTVGNEAQDAQASFRLLVTATDR